MHPFSAQSTLRTRDSIYQTSLVDRETDTISATGQAGKRNQQDPKNQHNQTTRKKQKQRKRRGTDNARRHKRSNANDNWEVHKTGS